ncbi:hypothetical protein HDC37_003349 [Microbacterium sp. AK009]|uniref:LamG-like jellyroll fold domain-containing protein n=1 Tax=Microbacterium sp. AK009 TaxID=2723068 RepID=UPI0015CCCBEA|nr:LamG-like jellyroll fold domain-containing protein [Microbacterium sp. AK009]NYF18485.1 hypothetical protein [Microbacterium sp. AK009]
MGIGAVSDSSVNGGTIDSSLKHPSTDGLLFDGSTASQTVPSPADGGGWLVVAYTQSPDQTMRCMINGVVSGPAITNPPSVNTFDQIYLGLAGGPWFNGDVAEFVIWPFGLTPLQMSAIHDAMRTRHSAFNIGE